MRIMALGTGSAFTIKNWQTNLLIEHNDKKLLIDCGTDVRFSLNENELSYLDIDAVYVSHAHADHIGGLEWLGFQTYFDPWYQDKPKMFCQKNLIIDLWDRSLSGGMKGLEGIDASLDTYFEPYPVPSNGSFEWEGIKFDLIQSIHVSAKYSIMETFGLMFNCPVTNQRIYHTSDVQFCPESSMMAYYKEADWILHDCETLYLPDGTPIKSGVHSHYEQLRTLPPEIKAKMTLIHYQDNVLNNWRKWQERIEEDGFLDLAEKGYLWL